MTLSIARVYECDQCGVEIKERLPKDWVKFNNVASGIAINEEYVQIREPVHFCSIDHFTRWVSDELMEIYSNSMATDKDYDVPENDTPENGVAAVARRFGRRKGEEHHEHFMRHLEEQQMVLEAELQLPTEVAYDRRTRESGEWPVRPFEPPPAP